MIQGDWYRLKIFPLKVTEDFEDPITIFDFLEDAPYTRSARGVSTDRINTVKSVLWHLACLDSPPWSPFDACGQVDLQRLIESFVYSAVLPLLEDLVAPEGEIIVEGVTIRAEISEKAAIQQP